MVKKTITSAAAALLALVGITGCVKNEGGRESVLKGHFTVYKQTFFKEGSVKEYRTFTADPGGQRMSDNVVRTGGRNKSEVRKYETLSGGRIKISIFDSQNRLKHYIVQEYEGKAEQIRRRSVFNPEGKEQSRTDYRYSATGALVAKVNYDGAGKLNGYSYDFDHRGNVARDAFYQAGVLRRSTTHDYNERGLVVQRSQFDATGAPTTRRLFTYDGRGNLTRQDDLSGIGQLTWRAESVFDRDGNRTTISLYDAPGGVPRRRFERSFEYDAKRNLVRVTNHDASGALTGSGTYEYDPDGRKRKQAYFDGKGGLIGFSTFTYRTE